MDNPSRGAVTSDVRNPLSSNSSLILAMLLPVGLLADTGTTLLLAVGQAAFKRRGRHCSNGRTSAADSTGGTAGISASLGCSPVGSTSILGLLNAGGVIAAVSVVLIMPAQTKNEWPMVPITQACAINAVQRLPLRSARPNTRSNSWGPMQQLQCHECMTATMRHSMCRSAAMPRPRTLQRCL